MSASLDLTLDYLPRLPRRKDFRIGCAGAGFIMRDCHLVAYRQAGFNPVAIASRDPARARACAERHGIPRVHQTYADLLADPAIEVLDIAVPPDVQPAILREAAQHGGHIRGILAQKPLALSYREAKECVDLCARAGIVLAVNQNMRYDQSVRALKDVLRRGWLGEPVLGTIEMRAIPHWMPWAQTLPSLSTFVMSIHHLDTFRYWFGTPDRVLASTRPDPRTRFPHRDGINLYILEYDNGCRAAAWDDVWTGPAREGAEGEIYIRWRVEGTDGLAHGTIGWPSYPARTPSTLRFSTRHQPGYWLEPRWPEVWFPDAFVGTMAQLLCALEEGKEPEISGRDNLETIALCEAVRAAAEEHRSTTVREFMANG
ncbi:MAG TPA: Gfo/Idh/MocA family oxidoreductase [Gemmataceae bacterium]|nr:Gfo/Idh/MocA family oxidoreductase [Gemmataceae bacterium]